MRVLFATKNPAKVNRFKSRLAENGIELLTLKDISVDIDVVESGKNAIENAYIKAKAYYEKTGMTTIGMDDNLFIEELPEERQPGVFVRRVNGKELNDDEMIEYYSNLAKEFGGKLTAKWVYGMVVYDGKEPKSFTWSKSNFYIVDRICEDRNPGYPLDSISILPQNEKYFVELTAEEKNQNNDNVDDGVIDFLLNSIKLTK